MTPLSLVQDKARPGRAVRIQETAEAKPDLGLSYLEYLFSRASTRDWVLALAQASLRPLHKTLGAWRVCTHSDLLISFIIHLHLLSLI